MKLQSQMGAGDLARREGEGAGPSFRDEGHTGGMRAMWGGGSMRAMLEDEQREETGLTPQSEAEEQSGAVW